MLFFILYFLNMFIVYTCGKSLFSSRFFLKCKELCYDRVVSLTSVVYFFIYFQSIFKTNVWWVTDSNLIILMFIWYFHDKIVCKNSVWLFDENNKIRPYNFLLQINSSVNIGSNFSCQIYLQSYGQMRSMSINILHFSFR